ncbi:hypothetical protein CR513_03375, partial [Mucuna pruriens]
MEGSSVDWGNLSPKIKFMMNYIEELVKKIDKDTQSVNAKEEALIRERDERPKVVSIHESEGSFEEGNYSEGNRSSWSSMGERSERHGRIERNRREERIEDIVGEERNKGRKR